MQGEGRTKFPYFDDKNPTGVHAECTRLHFFALLGGAGLGELDRREKML